MSVSSIARTALALVAAVTALAAAAQTGAPSVVVVTIDGLRWQEFFTGADQAYFKRDDKGRIDPIAARYDAPSPEARRALLMPFVWSVIAKRGQIFGDPARQSRAHAWDVLPSILNTDRSRVPVGFGFAPAGKPASDREREINQLAADLPAYWRYGTFDAPVVYAALDHIRQRKPRVLYLMLGEGDEWAHEGRYDLYLDATTRADRFIERIWTTLQSIPEYQGATTLLVTTDHGRGATTKDWIDHGREVPAAENTWIFAIGPDVAVRGVRDRVTVTTAQMAATIAAVVGEDFRAAAPQAAPPLPLRP